MLSTRQKTDLRTAIHFRRSLERAVAFSGSEQRNILALGMFHRSAKLSERIEGLLRQGRHVVPRSSQAHLAASLAALIGLAAGMSFLPRWIIAQPAAFEVASIKPSPPGLARDSGGVQIRFSPGGGFSASNVSLMDLVTTAYSLEWWQVSGGPEWSRPKGMTTESRFLVRAQPASAVSRAETRRMLQALLEDRFKLRSHRETKIQTVYDLVVARNGSKMQEVKVGDYGGNLVTRCCRGGLYMERTTMPDFAASFTMLGINTTVRDKTGLKGIYKFELHWSPEVFRSGEKQDNATNGETPFEQDAPSLREALRDQLGLALEAGKGPVEFLVIDRAERPSEN